MKEWKGNQIFKKAPLRFQKQRNSWVPRPKCFFDELEITWKEEMRPNVGRIKWSD